MKKLFVGLFVMLVSALAFALPSPKQIEDALANKNYADAKSMVQEVLREKPESARAHLLNAYLLIHVDKNRTAANTELQTAVGLDKNGDVKGSPLFGRVVTEIDMTATPTAKPAKALPQPQAGHSSAGNDLLLFLLRATLFLALIGAIVALVSWIIGLMRSRRETRFYGSPTASMAAGSPEPIAPAPAGAYYSDTFGTSFGNRPMHPAAVAPVVVAQQNPAMGAFGTAASVAGGVVAGHVLSDALLHRHSHYSSSRDDEEERARRRRREEDTYSAPAYTPSPVSYENERSSFSSGSSSSWGSSDSSSSNSSDSSSSSSSSDW